MGENLREIRKRAQQTQDEFAARFGVSRPYYTNIENGKRKPSVEVAKRIAAELGFEWTRFYE